MDWNDCGFCCRAAVSAGEGLVRLKGVFGTVVKNSVPTARGTSWLTVTWIQTRALHPSRIA